ncbi:ribosomal protein S18-alanine N-acetyltransferase [Candidatus Bathyarchaeota archaeon]|nr:ribosomal protein S18-alanine N-acetyltransferase [Candidatus Bathyarchaeota archaeon]
MLTTYKLRKFTMEDLNSVTRINEACLPENYTDIFFVDLYRRYPETFIVADENGHTVGYIMCRIEVGLSNLGLTGIVKKGHVVSIAVMPEHRRKGIAKALMTAAMEGMRHCNAKQCYLEVRLTNEAAVELYKKLGFEISRTVHGYYADGEDAYVMSLKL